MNFAHILLMMVLSACAVEAGNPIDEASEGTVKVSLVATQEPTLNLTSSGKRLDLFLDYVVLLGTDGDTTLQAEMTALQTQVDLFSAEEEILLAADSVPVGRYQQVVIVLTADRPFGYYDDDGEKQELEFQDTESYAIYINQDIEVVEGDQSLILLDFDPNASVITLDGRAVFRPRIKSFRKGKMADYSGSLATQGGAVVCAYRYDKLGDDDERSLRGHERQVNAGEKSFGLKKGKRPPPPGEEAEHPEEFEYKSDLVLDATSDCEHAFAKTIVADDGTYVFDRMKSGYYMFRAFYDDGTFTDEAQDVKL